MNVRPVALLALAAVGAVTCVGAVVAVAAQPASAADSAQRASVKPYHLGTALTVRDATHTTPAPKPATTPTPKPAVTGAKTATVSTAATTTSSTPTSYVALTGSDANAGTQSSPWRTLQFAVAHAAAGTTVDVAAGTYTGFTVTHPGLSIVGAGAGQTIISGMGGGSNVISIAAASTSISNVSVNGCTPVDLAGVGNGYENGGSGNIAIASTGSGATISNVVITGRQATNAYGLPFGCYGVVARAANNVTVTGSDISGTGAAVFLRQGGDNDVVTNNKIHDNTLMIRNTPLPYDDFGGDGIGTSSLNPVHAILISGNTIYDNSARSHDYGTDGSAFDIYGAYNLTITKNVAYNNENVIETGSGVGPGGGCGNFRVTENQFSGLLPGSTFGHGDGIIVRCARDSIFSGNTMTGLTWWAFWLTPRAAMPTEADNLTISNNTIRQTTHAIFAFSSDPHGHGLVIQTNTYSYQAAFAYDWHNKPMKNQVAFAGLTGCAG